MSICLCLGNSFDDEGSVLMECKLREWKLEDAPSLAEILNNRHVLDKLRDGLPYPYN